MISFYVSLVRDLVMLGGIVICYCTALYVVLKDLIAEIREEFYENKPGTKIADFYIYFLALNLGTIIAMSLTMCMYI